jgi:lysophospholipase L1-like esterase
VSVLPTTGEYAGLSQLVPPLNEHIMRIASQYACDYMNVYRLIVDDRGELRAEFSDDGLHLTEAAYKIWATLIEAWLELNTH